MDGRERTLLVHRKARSVFFVVPLCSALTLSQQGATRAFPPHHPLIPVDYQFTGQPVLIGGTMARAVFISLRRLSFALFFAYPVSRLPPPRFHAGHVQLHPHRHGQGHGRDVRQHVPRGGARALAQQLAQQARLPNGVGQPQNQGHLHPRRVAQARDGGGARIVQGCAHAPRSSLGLARFVTFPLTCDTGDAGGGHVPRGRHLQEDGEAAPGCGHQGIGAGGAGERDSGSCAAARRDTRLLRTDKTRRKAWTIVSLFSGASLCPPPAWPPPWPPAWSCASPAKRRKTLSTSWVLP